MLLPDLTHFPLSGRGPTTNSGVPGALITLNPGSGIKSPRSGIRPARPEASNRMDSVGGRGGFVFKELCALIFSDIIRMGIT